MKLYRADPRNTRLRTATNAILDFKDLEHLTQTSQNNGHRSPGLASFLLILPILIDSYRFFTDSHPIFTDLRSPHLFHMPHIHSALVSPQPTPHAACSLAQQ